MSCSACDEIFTVALPVFIIPIAKGCVLTAFRQAQYIAFRQAQYIALAIFSWWVKAFPEVGNSGNPGLTDLGIPAGNALGNPQKKWVWRWGSLLLSYAEKHH